MRAGPGLVFRGTIIGSFFIATFGYFITAGAAPLPSAAAPMAASVNVNNDQNVVEESPSTPAVQPTTAADKKPQKQKSAAGANKSSGNQKKSCEVSSNYPDTILQWCDLITSYSRQRGLSPDLIAAVMLQESGGDPGAYSSSGAVGLLQVMPRDGLAADFICGNRPCFSSRPTIQELEDPEYNIQYGTGMLANLLDKYGNIRDALAAYGPKDVGYYYADIVLAIYNRYGES